MRLNQYTTKVIRIGLLLIFSALNGCKFDAAPQPVVDKQTSIANAPNFLHPGINTQESLEYVRVQYKNSNAQYNYRRDGFAKVSNFINLTKSSYLINKNVTFSVTVKSSSGTLSDQIR